ncbi:hypothetical protein DL766_009614 [Monosporascus sp. MC13-8B]|uniref:Zn(2)-C6 fungal-type domain-containing protein n=1 Tax=Monosporascus cannonballus TaxID=155416 RepID=A0ABY0GUX1_9PEZI|nr:hypothetical protein DL762_009210 [Monosporascus cannonballus]RYO79450.1 hypothetical protein DL763_009260 [Monosporascus cannonballus]RYP14647.1 hypothetical protein DL766_009614 [Monosporascus sp. MC13-8B]
MNPNLSQIANEIPEVLSQYQYQRRLTPEDIPLDSESECDFSQWIDLDKLCGDSTEEDPENRSKSDVISMPGLTSGPSEEGGSSPLPLPEDRARAKARLDDAKKQDDELTIPRRELRPKGHQYPLSIHVFSAGEDSVANMTDDSRESTGNDSSFWSSPSGGNSPFTESGSSETSKPDRGRRKKPLSDRDAVAEVRELGACVRCHIRKLKCNCREVCEKCIDHAQKNSGSASPLLGRQLCFRRKLSEIGLAFDRFFGTSHHNLKRSCLGQLGRRKPRQKPKGLPTYSQRLMISCRHAWIEDGISHWIWRTNTLLYYRSDFYGPLRPLPASVHRELKGIARSAMSSLERDILSGFDRFLKADLAVRNKTSDIIKSLFVTLAIMFEGYFKNKALESHAERGDSGPQGRIWNDLVSNLISQEGNPVDYVLNVLLKKPRKSQNQARQPKRQKVVS